MNIKHTSYAIRPFYLLYSDSFDSKDDKIKSSQIADVKGLPPSFQNDNEMTTTYRSKSRTNRQNRGF